MKLLYKASIIILFACHLMTAIANNRQFNPSTEITGIYSHNNDQFHNYEGINSIVDKNYFQGLLWRNKILTSLNTLLTKVWI